MFILTIEDTFASAHQLRGYRGKCENIHGHNWRVVLSVEGNTLDDIGLLIDFQDLKKTLKEITTYLDHKNLNDIAPFDKENPSSENIAKFIATEAQTKLNNLREGLRVQSVTVWESDTSRCTYLP
ncbi:MAG TPA: 6-carboxytetrahydropterin synthase QueD [Spirochaetota bacterium]|jgi:6-pyruvoyltetrahydropterin/6-carboxytetrahydropterin synthase|nr:6-carboxytetrahydropterin synthase QueD [Spirochaetota bacterium]OQB00337.1 MAG: 6-carboxy-5,6,7,8-tetrahydropterin synthase [Spirochaetes bacterium ADurb.Bin218]HOK02337.1 6-carboxytetrahydropterin synthase QueD [Spirochaetota bacterium]HOK92525.1 6-carboxytetrahydropterin synthase QueD [Spirochaetota bacterium]HOQ13242.1 6-carboxytetrahydropterin synthase QueD [Spirochaetota bacterium]